MKSFNFYCELLKNHLSNVTFLVRSEVHFLDLLPQLCFPKALKRSRINSTETNFGICLQSVDCLADLFVQLVLRSARRWCIFVITIFWDEATLFPCVFLIFWIFHKKRERYLARLCLSDNLQIIARIFVRVLKLNETFEKWNRANELISQNFNFHRVATNIPEKRLFFLWIKRSIYARKVRA